MVSAPFWCVYFSKLLSSSFFREQNQQDVLEIKLSENCTSLDQRTANAWNLMGWGEGVGTSLQFLHLGLSRPQSASWVPTLPPGSGSSATHQEGGLWGFSERWGNRPLKTGLWTSIPGESWAQAQYVNVPYVYLYAKLNIFVKMKSHYGLNHCEQLNTKRWMMI